MAKFTKTECTAINLIAKTCHEANRAYCEAIGDSSQKPWSQSPEWQTSSAISGVKFHLKNPDAPPSASHEKWLKDKIKSGWVFGLIKDPETKRHPCILPFDDLPLEQKAKDYIFTSIVGALRCLATNTKQLEDK